jgi:hypothetical protein
VVHAQRPEWGIGLVTGAQRSVQDGRACQRLTIRFDRAGVKTLSTALADLRSADDMPRLALTEQEEPVVEEAPDAPANGDGGWLGRLSASAPDEVMLKLPEAATDPFSTLQARLGATFALYRFTPAGASLLDWAAAQSGLKDPLSRFNRHELERLFGRFVMIRDEHLKRLAQEMRKKDPSGLAGAIRSAPPAVQQTLRRLDALR